MKLEVREDYLTGRRAVISVSRRFRPKEENQEQISRNLPPERCPFCPGNEHMTPPEIARMGGKKWKVRVFRNKYPAFSPNPPRVRAREILEKFPALGDHEVIVDVPDHYAELENQPTRHITLAFKMFEKRVKELGRKYKYALLIKNRGSRGGASLMHSHAQVLAFDYMPEMLETELYLARLHYEYKGKNVFDRIIELEHGGPRLVYENPEVLVISPFAPRIDFHLSFISKMPRFPKPSYVADAFKTVVQAMNALLGAGFPYNFYVNYPPFWDDVAWDYYRWNLQLLPRVQTWAGFELGTGDSIITVSPEEWAKALRRKISKGGKQ